jgi:nitrous oxidase accessory protein NosD
MARPVAPRRAALALGAMALAGALLAGLAPAAVAAPPACRVKNPTQDTWFATETGQALTRAIAAADPGDRLNVFGRCRGSFSIDKALRIFGNTNRLAPTVLDGAGAAGVLFVNERVTVTLTRLTITGGNATVRVGGGIQNGGILTLNRSTVTGNRSASDGGGIYNYGNLTLNDSRLTANTAGGGGGGLFSEGVATLNRSAVTGNTAAYGGGILSVNTLTLNQTTVSGNLPDDCACS